MSGIVLAAMGNRLRRDDGVGPMVLDRLAKMKLPEDLSLLWLEQDPYPLSLLDPSLKAVMIIDALTADLDPGSIISLPICELAYQVPLNLHQLLPAELLPQTLFNRTQVLGIVPQNLGYGLELSPSVAKAALRAVRYLHTWAWATAKAPLSGV